MNNTKESKKPFFNLILNTVALIGHVADGFSKIFAELETMLQLGTKHLSENVKLIEINIEHNYQYLSKSIKLIENI
jgi:hypothetical protein